MGRTETVLSPRRPLKRQNGQTKLTVKPSIKRSDGTSNLRKVEKPVLVEPKIPTQPIPLKKVKKRRSLPAEKTEKPPEKPAEPVKPPKDFSRLFSAENAEPEPKPEKPEKPPVSKPKETVEVSLGFNKDAVFIGGSTLLYRILPPK